MRETVPNSVTTDSQTVDDLLGRDHQRQQPYPWNNYTYQERLEHTTYYPAVSRLVQPELEVTEPEATMLKQPEYTPSQPKPWMQELMAQLYSETLRHNPKHLGRFALDRYHPHDFTD